MTVYIAHEPRPFRSRVTGELSYPDLSPASTYGAVKFVFDKDDQPALTSGLSINKARKALRDFNDEDFLLWAGGDPVALAICSMVVSEINRGRYTFLRWERNSARMEGAGGAGGFYIPVKMNLHP